MSHNIRAAPRLHVTLHARWRVVPDGSALSEVAWTRLPSYVTRYAQTLGVVVYAVGGSDDHLHLLFELPSGKTLDSVTSELQKAVSRFLQDVLGLRGFAWAKDGVCVESVSRAEMETVREYVGGNAAYHVSDTTLAVWEDQESDDGEDLDALPDWLRDVLPPSSR